MAEAFEKPLGAEGEPSPSALDISEETQSDANRIKRAEWPDRPPSSKAMVPGTLANFEYLARKHDVRFKFNRVKKRVDIEIPGDPHGSEEPGRHSAYPAGEPCHPASNATHQGS